MMFGILRQVLKWAGAIYDRHTIPNQEKSGGAYERSTPKGARVVPFKKQSEGNGLRSLQMTADQLLFATHHLSLTNETVYAGSMGSFSARPPSRNHTWFTGGLPWKGLPGISDTIKCKPTKNHLLAGYTYCYSMLKATHLQIR